MKTVSICFVLLGIIQLANGSRRATLVSPTALHFTYIHDTGAFVPDVAPQQPTGATVLQILTNRSLWGKDFGACLSRIPGWSQIAESTVVVFSDRVMGNTGYETRKQAETAAANLETAITTPPKQAAQVFRELLAAKQDVRLRPQVMPYADDFLHVYLADSAIQMLNPDLTPASLEEQLGKPERVSKLTIQGKGDRRGVVLTLFAYAGGKIVFAQADLSSRPGRIDRVFLDVPAVMAALFQEAK
jgi:hypothetical protein